MAADWILTPEKELLCCTEKAMLGLGVCDRVEPPDTHDFPDRLPTAVIRVRVSAQDATQICLKPQLVCCRLLLPMFVHAVALDCAGDGDVYPHVQPRKCIVTTGRWQRLETKQTKVLHSELVPINAFHNLHRRCLAMVTVCESVDVSGETGRGRSVDAGDMMVDSDLASTIISHCDDCRA